MDDMDMRIVEIAGVKLEIDTRTARKVEQYRIGSQVKVLVKEGYGDKYVPHPGVIVGFDAFEKLPTITVAYLEIDYSGAKIKFSYINPDTEDVELAPFHDDILVDKAEVVSLIDRDIAKHQAEIEDLERKKAYFLQSFTLYFKAFDDMADRVDG